MAAKNILTAARLREMLHYNPIAGEFRWLERRQGRKLTAVPGYHHALPNGQTRIIIVINKRNYKAHRLAWLYMTGQWPQEHIDHINGDPADNRWSNLREATFAQNRWNRGVQRNTKLVGAHYDRFWNRWQSAIGGKSLGHFKTKEEAHEAYRQAALEKYGKFAHHSLTRPER